ncbi:MAG: hypothetical protein FJW36_12865 [Acidobacteria bacterium]|nr:hypothetical protein [Acidobacteriota bacterium]
MNPTENEQNLPLAPENAAKVEAETPKEPIVGYCRGTGKPLTSAEATYIKGVLYSKEYAEQAKLSEEPASPYAEPMVSVPKSTADISPGWAFVLGFIPGVGAIYNQQYAKGMFHIIVFASLISLIDRPGVGPFIGFLVMGWFLYMPFEAYHTAQRRQRGEAVDEMSGLVTMPAGMQKLPVGPILLIALGVLFLLDNLGLLRIDDLLRFWPVLLIVIGVVLLMQRIQGANGGVKEGSGNAN